MAISLKSPELRELKPRILVCGIGGGGCNAVNNMIDSGLSGVDFIVANTDAQALTASRAERIIQMGLQVTEGLGAGAQPEIGRAAAEEAIEEIRDHLMGAHMCFVTAGMGGGTGTGAAPVIARAARDLGILTVGVVTKPFQFEGSRRMRTAEAGISELQKAVDTLIVIPNQNLFRIATERTTFADAFAMADQVLFSGVASITNLMIKQGLVNLDFADVRSVMREMGKAMMGTGEASGERRAILAAEAAIANPLLDEVSMKGARGLLISISGGADLTLYELDEAASRIRQEVDEDANIILGAIHDEELDGVIRVSVVATGIDRAAGDEDVDGAEARIAEARIAEAAQRLRAQAAVQRAPEAPRPVENVASPAPEPVVPQPTPQPVVAQPTPVQPAHEYVEAADFGLPQNEFAQLEAYGRQDAYEPMVYAPSPYEASSYEPQAPHQQTYAAPPRPTYPRESAQRPRPMPSVDDLPAPVQEQLRQRGQAPGSQAVDQRRRTLFERLASFAGSKDETHVQEPSGVPPRVAPIAPPAQPRQNAPVHAEYAKRPVPPARAAAPAARAVSPRQDDEQLEIPAFLRRQSS